MTSPSCFEPLVKANTFASLPADFYTRLPTTPLTAPRLVHASAEVAAVLGLPNEALDTQEFLDVVSGTKPLPGGDTMAAVYSGHQFGVWAGQLGDGRAHLLGEIQGPDGSFEVQLKGAGMTPYSRMGDGRAVLRSSVREYLASHAMRGLGIPTTQALSLVSARNPVRRETLETAAVVARVAPSFIRFGSFEHWAARRRPDLLRTLADYVIDRFYPECRDENARTASASDSKTSHASASGAITQVENSSVSEAGSPQKDYEPYVQLLRAVVRRTATLMASWQVVGFCHGVMNTDNMSILGLTLDYGPYGFMDGFDAKHICNHTDSGGRYAWHAQPAVAHWNLYQLANSLHEIVPEAEPLKAALDEYEACFLGAMQARMSQKLGLSAWQAGDETLIDDLWSLMQASHADFTLTFRQLAYAPGLTQASQAQIEHDLGGTVNANLLPFVDLFVDRAGAQAWLSRYSARVGSDPTQHWQERVAGMLAVNPLYVLRNHIAQQAIEAAEKGDFSEVQRQMQLLSDPFQARAGLEAYAAAPPAGAPHLEVSCSS
ncbi:MAG: YdiU family protein [Candidatus Methylopumilus sp.]|nr:YdiU family protein [Candidatus Methylopumilus sp.]